MIENNYKKQDAENWISKAAKNDADQQLALRVYTSRLTIAGFPRNWLNRHER